MYDGLSGSIVGIDSMLFVEFVNPGPSSRPIGGLHVTGQIDVVLPELTLAVGERIVLARFPELIERFFQIDGNVFFWNAGSINDATGHFRLTNTAGVIIDSLTFSNLSPWPTGANATGRSIVVCDPSQDNSIGSNWVESSTIIDSVGIWYGANIPGPIWASPGRANCRLVAVDNAEVIATKIYPNPFYSTFEIETKSTGLVSALITDAMGRNIKIASLVDGYAKVDLASQPPGIYFVSLIDQDGRVLNVKKLIHY
ncbi:MAG: T9SS type A sorting domain-containing protein [Bacteroidetes bacterium]|nr:T9SS type A sorting domain-containing protein [Bacteroidota bacterium]